MVDKLRADLIVTDTERAWADRACERLTMTMERELIHLLLETHVRVYVLGYQQATRDMKGDEGNGFRDKGKGATAQVGMETGNPG